MPFSQKYIEKMNARWEQDHDACYAAFYETGDFRNLQKALYHLGRQEYDEMNRIIKIMVQGTATIRFSREDVVTKLDNIKIEEEEKEEEEVIDKITPSQEVSEDEPIPDPALSQRNSPSEEILDSSSDQVLKSSSNKIRRQKQRINMLRSCRKRSKNAKVQQSSSSVSAPSTPKIHRYNIILTSAEIELVENLDVDKTCDLVECTKCTVYPYPNIPCIGKDSLMIYAGPGSGKTYCIRLLQKRYGRRIMIRDTDHLALGVSIPPRSLVFTNRHDIFRQYDGAKIAFIPFRRHWIRQCLTKCSDTKDSWFDDMITNIRRSLVIRRNCYLSDCIRFYM